MAEAFSLESLEKVQTIATLMVAMANRRTMAHGTPGNRITVELDLMRQLAQAVEESAPGAVERVRASLAEATRRARQTRCMTTTHLDAPCGPYCLLAAAEKDRKE